MIKFGTSGWRDIIAQGFTFEGVRIVSQAIVNQLKDQNNDNNIIIVGYDTRFMSEDFAKASAEVLAGNGYTIYFSKEDVPTPCISYEIIRTKALGGINITASHNPYNYNGLKFSPSWGGPALPETTQQIEKNVSDIQKNLSLIKKINFDDGIKSGIIKISDFKDNYLKRIAELIDFDVIKKSNIKVAVDVMHGAARGYLDKILNDYGIKNITINTSRDPYFNGHHPEPSSEFLGEIINLVKNKTCDMAIATDGDADRFGIVDICGEYISANDFLAVLLYHLVKNKNYKGVAARSVMTSSFIDAVAKSLGVDVRETPVGFKYIGDILVNEDLIVGGEESGGLTISGHVPEKDGILAVLLAVEVVAKFGKGIKEIIKDLKEKVGDFLTSRKNFRLEQKKMLELKEKLFKNPPKTFGNYKVKKLITIDGFKFIFDDDSWLGIRLSGTEPIVRCYVEAHDLKTLNELLILGEKEILN